MRLHRCQRHLTSICALFVASIALLVVPSKYAYSENPFTGSDAPVGQPPTGTPPDFSEDDEFAPDNSFGFTPPSAAKMPDEQPLMNNGGTIPNPNANTFEGPASATPPSRPSYPSGPKGNFGSATSPSGSTVTRVQPGKAAPKLADYLELDSSVKGLEVKNFDLPDKDIKDVVTLISKWTGKNFIIDNKVRGKITIIGPSQVTLQEAYQAFLSALDANGLTTVQSGKFIRIIESAEARRAPVKTYAGEYAPKDDQFITRIFQLKYINSDEVQREFRDLTTRQGKLFAYEPTNSIIITDTGSNIQRIKEILETLDVKNFETTLHVLRIRNGSAKTISDMLGEIYGDAKGSGNGQPRSFRRSALERTRGGGIISKIIPDEQTNSLVVLANQAGYEMLKQLVEKLDVRVTDTGRIHVYYCEYAKAEDLASTLASLAQGGGKSGGSKKGGSSAPSITPGAPAAPAASGSSSSSGPVTAELDGGAKVTSDAATNSLVIIANSADWQTLKRVIKKLDIPRLQVFVESAILEVALGDSTNIGTNIGLAAAGKAFVGGSITDSSSLFQYISGQTPPDGATIPIFPGPTFPVQVPVGTTGQTTTVNVSSFMGLLNLISSNTNTSILSTPQILALDNEKAEFQNVDEIPVQSTFTALPAGTTTGLAGSTPTGSIENKKVGIVIKLTPHVNAASRTVRLEIEQKVDSIKNDAAPKALNGVQIATTSRVTNTSVIVHDQDYVMLGGLMSDKIDDTVKKVPFLGDIPILGWLFKSSQKKVTKTNLIILMHPRIIDSSYVAASVISENLKRRDEFINKNNGGEDPFKDDADRIRKDVKQQKARAKNEAVFDYRNNNDEELDTKVKPGERSEIENGSQSSSRKPKDSPKESKNITPPGAAPGGANDSLSNLNDAGSNNLSVAPPPDAPLIEGGGQGQ